MRIYIITITASILLCFISLITFAANEEGTINPGIIVSILCSIFPLFRFPLHYVEEILNVKLFTGSMFLLALLIDAILIGLAVGYFYRIMRTLGKPTKKSSN